MFFIDDIPAKKDIWLVGDAFLKNAFHTLRSMRRPANVTKSSNEVEPYVWQRYNVKHYYLQNPFRRKNAASRILNAFIEALNDNKKSMPRMIIFLPRF